MIWHTIGMRGAAQRHSPTQRRRIAAMMVRSVLLTMGKVREVYNCVRAHARRARTHTLEN